MQPFIAKTPYERAKSIIDTHLYGYLHNFFHRYAYLLPEEIDMGSIMEVLDIVCGSGNWLYDMAYLYPDKHFTGLDEDPWLMRYARTQAQIQEQENISFLAGDMYSTELPDEFYDLVHSRFLTPRVACSRYGEFIQEMSRVLRRGGLLVWQEIPYPRTNSKVCNVWLDLLRQAFQSSGYIPEISSHMETLLAEARYHSLQRIITPIDISTGTQAYRTISTRAWEMLSYVQFFLVHTQVVSQEEIEHIQREMLIDLFEETFTGSVELVTVVGVKA